MKRIALIALAALATGCSTTRTLGQSDAAPESDVAPKAAAQVSIAERVVLSLPATPGYPEERLLFQTLIGRYEARTRGFQATLSLSPERVEIILLAASGPRVMELAWTAEGIVETRSRLAPEDLDGLNILADIFISVWPKEAVAAALPQNAALLDGEGGREIWRGETRIIDIEHRGVDDAGRSRSRLTHLERGYVLDIISEDLEAR